MCNREGLASQELHINVTGAQLKWTTANDGAYRHSKMTCAVVYSYFVIAESTVDENPIGDLTNW